MSASPVAVASPKSVVVTTSESSARSLASITPPGTVSVSESAVVTTTTTNTLSNGWKGFITFFVTFIIVFLFSALCLYLSSPPLIRSSEDPTLVLQEKLFGWAALFGVLVAILFTMAVTLWRPSTSVVVTKVA